MIRYLTITFFFEALVFLGLGLRVLLAKRPILFNARWLLAFMVVVLSPMILRVRFSLLTHLCLPRSLSFSAY